MFVFSIFVIFLAVSQKNAVEIIQESTLPIQERVAFLKYQIVKEIESNQNFDKRYHNDVSASLEKTEYVDIDKEPITPINENDERKKHGRFRLNFIKTTTETPWSHPKPETIKKKTTQSIQRQKEIEAKKIEPDNNSSDEDSSSDEKKPKLLGIDKILNMAVKNNTKNLRNDKSLPSYKMKPENNIFYRRIFLAEFQKHCSKETVHCIDLLTPVLTGQKINITYRNILTYKDQEVMRLLQLLSEDTSDFTKDEIYSNLYQISNLQIRLFQWDISSLKLLLNVITRVHGTTKRHTFKSIKSGLKDLLTSWHLDFTNVTNLLYQARIFRPPCIGNGYSGSTQSSKTVRYTKKVKPKCAQGEEFSGSCEL